MILVYPDTYFFPIEQENNIESTREFVDKDKDIMLISRDAEEKYYNELLEDTDESFIDESTESIEE